MKKAKKQSNRKGVSDDFSVKSVSISSGYKLSKAVLAESYDPKMIDDWYRKQRRNSLEYAKNLVAY